MRHDLRQMQDLATEEAIERVTAAHKTRIAKARKIEDQFRELVRKTNDDGFRVSDTSVFDVSDATMDRAIQDARSEVGKQAQQARRLLAGKEYEAKRNLLKATISREALLLLEGLPDATSIMEAAAKEVKQLGR